jgi:hypothetical protein
VRKGVKLFNHNERADIGDIDPVNNKEVNCLMTVVDSTVLLLRQH